MSKPAWLQGAAVSAAEPTASSGHHEKRKKPIGGQWTALGVSEGIVKNLELRGFKSPTPIQRSTIPLSLATPPRDVLGMARTGSGKTLAYIIPLLQRLGMAHRETSGPRAIIMCPTRELALQILKVGKDLARGSKKGKEPDRQPLRWAVIIGGTALDAQFESMSNQPDIVIATPGRFLHLLVEMSLDLRSAELAIYDEADRLFEMGFESQLNEITYRLPPTRQSLLFSATLPTTVAEFAKASLTNPSLIRLDADANISPDLTLSFYAVKPVDKDAVLVLALRRTLRETQRPTSDDRRPQAIVFCATKHHVEYLTTLISAVGFATSSVFGSLDQVARQRQLKAFQDGHSEVLVVTDVAARGLDIPIMENVINYDHPANSRLFIHRVGRTARAGRKGRAISLVTKDDLAYMCDLENLIGVDFEQSEPALIGAVPRALIDDTNHSLRGLEQEEARTLPSLREVMRKGQGMYERSRPKASASGYRKAKNFDPTASTSRLVATHPDFTSDQVNPIAEIILKQALADYTPSETIMELGRRGQATTSGLMTNRRRVLEKKKEPAEKAKVEMPPEAPVVNPTSKFRDPAFYMQHEKSGREREKGYSMSDEQGFNERIQSSTLDIAGDEGRNQGAQKASQLRWDRKKKRFTPSEQVGSDNKKMIRSESGRLLPATYSSGRYREWRARRRHETKSGETPASSATGSSSGSGLLDARAIQRRRAQKAQRLAKNARPARKAR